MEPMPAIEQPPRLEVPPVSASPGSHAIPSHRHHHRPRRLRRVLFRIVIAMLILAALVPAYAYLYYEYVSRSKILQQAGAVTLIRLETGVSASTILPMTTGTENAAFHYVTALNSFTRRRVPYLK